MVIKANDRKMNFFIIYDLYVKMDEYYNMENGIKIPKLCLTITCSWPYENRPFWQKFIAFSWLFIGFIYTLLMYIEPIISLKSDGPLKLLATIPWALLLTAYLAKYANFVYNKQNVVDWEKLLSDRLFYNHPEKLNRHLARAIRYSDVLGKYYMGMVAVYVTMYSISPLFGANKNLPTPISIDFGKYLPIIYFIQAFGLAHSGIANGALDILFVSMVLLGCCQLDILNEKILNLRDVDEEIEDESTLSKNEIDRKLIRKLSKIVKHHHQILKYFEYQEEIFSVGLLVQFVSSVIGLSALGFSMILVPPNTSDFYLAVVLFILAASQILFYCYFGEMVMVKSVQIADACYIFNWYKCNPVIIKSLIIIMQRSAKPLAITFMKFAPFSLELFKNLLRTSYSYLALLMRLANKND